MSRRSNGEGNISQRANGTWTARIQLGIKEDGKPKVKAFLTEEDLKVLIHENSYIPFSSLQKALDLLGVDASILRKDDSTQDQDVDIDDIFEEYE